MPRYLVFLLIMLALVVVVCPSVFGVSGEVDISRPIVQQTDWPAGVADVLNSQKPVYAFFVNFQDNYYYSGDAAAFNDFMARYAELSGIPHTLVLHCGRGEVKDRIADSADGQPSYAFDWYVFVVPPMIPDGGLDKSSPYKRYVTVNLYLGCNIQLSDIKVPGNVTVKPGKEIDQFIKKHEATFPNTVNPPQPSISNNGARPAPSSFSIYLAEDDKLNATDALKVDLADIKLQSKPLFTLDDFVCYSWKDHSFILTQEAVEKLPKARVFGVPFVVMVNGQRIYLGAFWTHVSSASFANPVICTDPFLLPSQGGRFTVDRNYASPDLPEDPRDSPAVRAIFQAAGKLDTCRDAALQSSGTVFGPPVAGSEFGIYLLWDQRITAVDALKLKLDDIVLQDKPLFTMKDVVEYHWPDHRIALWGKSMSKLPMVYKRGAPIEPLPYGIPFVVVAGGKRVYLGGFFPPAPPRLESVSFPKPAIVLVHPLARSSSILGIAPAYPRSTPGPKDDPRDSPLIEAAFGSAGKLHVDVKTPCDEGKVAGP